MDDAFGLLDLDDDVADYDPAEDFAVDDEHLAQREDGDVGGVQTSAADAPAELSPQAIILPIRLGGTPGRKTPSGALLELLPPVPARRSRVARRNDDGTPGGRRQHSDDRPTDRPGDRLARSIPVSQLLEALGWEHHSDASSGGSRWIRPDNSHSDNSHDAEVYPATDDEPERVTIFSENQKAAWGIEENQSWSSFDLLGNVFCVGDWKLAARIAAGEPSLEELVGVLGDHPTPDALGEAFPVLTTSVAEAFEAKKNATPIGLPDGLSVVVGGPSTGLYVELPKGEDGQARTHRITDWVAYRSLRRKLVQIGHDHRAKDVETRYQLRLIRSDGRVFPLSELDFDIEQSTSLTAVNLLDAGVSFPVKTDDRRHVENMLRTLGFDEIATEHTWTSTGWAILDDGRIVFLAPNGSITSAGVDDTITVGPPVGSDAGALKPAQKLLGWKGTSDDPTSTIDAINAFLDMTPTRPEIAVTLIGAVFAAPLRMSQRVSIGINGEAGSNKSLIVAATYAFHTAHPVTRQAIPISIAGNSSVPGVNAQLGWHRDIVLFADDYRRTDRSLGQQGAQSENVMRALVQVAYGGQGANKATQSGGLRSGIESTATVIFSGELIPPEAAIMQRCVSIPVAKGDIDTVGDDNRYDVFKLRFANTGLARSFFGSYLRFLAQEIEVHDERLAWLADAADRDFDDYYQEFLRRQKQVADGAAQQNAEIGRAAETAAVISVGWRWLRAFAAKHGVADRLPSEKEIERCVGRILESNTREQVNADPGLRILETASEMITANNGHLLMNDGSRPLLGTHSPGWLMSSTPTGEPRWDPKGALLGYISTDRKHVLIVNDALRTIQRAAGLDGLEKSQIKRSLAKHVVAGTSPGERSPLGMFDRRRGFVFELEKLDLSAGDDKVAGEDEHEDF